MALPSFVEGGQAFFSLNRYSKLASIGYGLSLLFTYRSIGVVIVWFGPQWYTEVLEEGGTEILWDVHLMLLLKQGPRRHHPFVFSTLISTRFCSISYCIDKPVNIAWYRRTELAEVLADGRILWMLSTTCTPAATRSSMPTCWESWRKMAPFSIRAAQHFSSPNQFIFLSSMIMTCYAIDSLFLLWICN